MTLRKHHLAFVALLGLGIGIIGCDDDDDDGIGDPDGGNMLDGGVDAPIGTGGTGGGGTGGSAGGTGGTSDGGVDAGMDDAGMTDAGTTDAGTTDAGMEADAGTDAALTSNSCTSYCMLIEMNCTGGNAQYANMGGCVSQCNEFPEGTVGATGGNSLACRTYHAGLAASDPGTHCPHAGPTGFGVCVDPT